MKPRILVAYDFSPAAQSALAWALDLHHSAGGDPVHVLHVINPVPAVAMPEMTTWPALSEAEMAALARQLESDVRERSADAVAEVVRAPWIASAILEAARRLKADLIVMGTHARKGVSRLMLGSAAEYVVRHAECPVVTLHSPPDKAPSL
ncbi:MAG TPA: universal stress protein [Myxococcales bacterium]|nr:universal stress protein [Myxococcales bacterium]